MKRSSSFRSCSANQALTSTGAFIASPSPRRRLGSRSSRHAFPQRYGCPASPAWRTEEASKIALLLLLLHRRAARIAVDRAALPLARLADQHLGDDSFDRIRVALDRTRKRIAAESSEPHLAHHRLLARFEPHPLVVDHQDQAVAFDRRPLGREVERHDLDLLPQNILPHVELGPVGQREDADALALALADIVERPQLGPLPLRVPAVIAVAEAEHALLRAALFLVAPGAAERGVEAVLVERLLQPFGLPHVGVQRPVIER